MKMPFRFPLSYLTITVGEHHQPSSTCQDDLESVRCAWERLDRQLSPYMLEYSVFDHDRFFAVFTGERLPRSAAELVSSEVQRLAKELHSPINLVIGSSAGTRRSWRLTAQRD